MSQRGWGLGVFMAKTNKPRPLHWQISDSRTLCEKSLSRVRWTGSAVKWDEVDPAEHCVKCAGYALRKSSRAKGGA